MDRLDCVVIGAGVVGLAVARRLALAGREVAVLESSDAIGSETSSRNSEVVHAGIYYPKGSLKARLCVAGKERLYAYCAERGVPHARCGKLIVATSEEQAPRLDAIRAKAEGNGVHDLTPQGPAAVRAMEPAVRCTGALLSPSTGIFDSHAFMLALRGDAEDAGAFVVLESPVEGGAVREDGVELAVGGGDPTRVRASLVVNAAGLHAPAVADRIEGFPQAFRRKSYFAKGNYYGLVGAGRPFSRLVYPVPERSGLGIHVTIDLGGQVRFGPDVEWIDGINYDVDPRRADVFYDAIRRYFPALPDGSLTPAYAGVRPKLAPAGAVGDDFVIEGPETHGVPGLVNLFGIESPGLTASLALADHVADLVGAPLSRAA